MKSVFVVSCFIVLAGCGSEEGVTQVVACTSDLECPAGQICSEDHSHCVAVDASDLDSWPAPKTTEELLSRFGHISFAAGNNAGAQTLNFAESDAAPLAQTVNYAALSARVVDSTLILWNAYFSGSGGLLTVWPVARDSSVTLTIQSIGVSFAEPITTPIINGEYPTATANGLTTLNVVTNLGTDPNDTIAVTSTLDNAIVQVSFSVANGLLDVAVHIEATGGTGWLEAQNVTLDAIMSGNEVPPHWLP